MLLHHDLVGCNVPGLGSTAGFGLLELGEQLEGVQVRGRDQSGLNGGFVELLKVCKVKPGSLPSDLHQSLLGHLNLHVTAEFSAHAKHGRGGNAVNVDDGQGLAAGQERVKVVDGVLLPGHDLWNQLITSIRCAGPMVVLMNMERMLPMPRSSLLVTRL